jgi:hypothetical protein
VSAILISSAATIKRINSNGVKKMCRNIFAVQHTLTASITGTQHTLTASITGILACRLLL